MKVCTLALVFLFSAGSLEAARKTKTSKPAAAKSYRAKRNTHALKAHKGSSKSRHARTRVN